MAIVASPFLPPPLRRRVRAEAPSVGATVAIRGVLRSRGAQSAAEGQTKYFFKTPKGIRKEIATGVKKPDTRISVAKAGNRPSAGERDDRIGSEKPACRGPACTEDIDYRAARGLDKQIVRGLIQDWVPAINIFS
jgi:hypothetical protein